MRFAIRFSISSLLILTSALPAFAQEKNVTPQKDTVFDSYPDTIVGRRAAEFMNAYNSGAKAKIKDYLEAHMAPSILKQQPLAQLVPAFVSIHRQIGNLNVFAIEEHDEFSVVIKTQPENQDIWIDIAFSVDPDPPHHQGNLGITPGRAPTAIDYSEWNDLSELLSLLRKQTHAPSMAIAIVRNGKLSQSAISGVREAGTTAETELSDRYHIGSVGKSMTAVLVGRLIELKKLDWETTIADVLDDVDMQDEYRVVTVRQLLNHQGGIHPFVDDRRFDRSRFNDESLSPEEQRLALATDALSRQPAGPIGGTTLYSNAGYVILGAIAERVTGTPFEDLMTKHVFEPLNFESAGFGWPLIDGRPNQPAGHVRVGDKVQVVNTDDANMGQFLVPAGDMHFSITDLARYAAFQVNGIHGKSTTLKTDTIKQLHQPPVDQNYAAGWIIRKAPDGSPLHFHNGSLGCYYAAVFLYPQHEAAVVVATNLGTSVEPEVLKAVESLFNKQIR